MATDSLPISLFLFCETRSKRSVEVYRGRNLDPQTVTNILECYFDYLNVSCKGRKNCRFLLAVVWAENVLFSCRK